MLYQFTNDEIISRYASKALILLVNKYISKVWNETAIIATIAKIILEVK